MTKYLRKNYYNFFTSYNKKQKRIASQFMQ